MGRALGEIGRVAGNLVEHTAHEAAHVTQQVATEVNKAVNTTLDSAVQGIQKATQAGVGAAQSAFEKILPAVQKGVTSPALGGIGVLAGMPGPAKILDPLGNKGGKQIGDVLKHLNDPGFDISKNIKGLADSLSDMNQEIQMQMQDSMGKMAQMQEQLGNVLKHYHETNKQIISNVKV